VRARGRFTVALAGGGTPAALYRELATTHRAGVDWAATHVFFGDERCVPPHDPRSNWRMASDALLSHVHVPPRQTHRIPGELAPADAAAAYEAALRLFFGVAAPAPPPPRTFDLVLLGVGPDGHTASLFPGDAAAAERVRWVAAAAAPPGMEPTARVTLTRPVLDRARTVLVLAAGAAKRDIVRRILAADPDDACRRWPAACARGAERTVWLLDAAAAGGGPGT
jgi:6-phosphogluconolactonase